MLLAAFILPLAVLHPILSKRGPSLCPTPNTYEGSQIHPNRSGA